MNRAQYRETKMVSRRNFLAATTVGGISTLSRTTRANPKSKEDEILVAAIQFAPILGDVDGNLSRVESFIEKAKNQRARWIVLPEFFTSGFAIHPSMFDAVRPVDGAPTRFLKDMAKEHEVYIGGSFLASSEGDVFNTFVLASPYGSVVSHDKDFPTFDIESSFYAAGDDEAYVEKIKRDGFETVDEPIKPRDRNVRDGVLKIDDRTVGAALCWELIRYGTTRRLDQGKIELLLGSSGWWWSSPEFGWPGRTEKEIAADRVAQLALIREAPRRQARMLGVPVVHANFVGINPGFESTDFERPCKGRYLGQSQIVDASGEPLCRLNEKEEGVAIAKVKLARQNKTQAIPTDEFWMPDVNEGVRKRWSSRGASGRDFYLKETHRRIQATAD